MPKHRKHFVTPITLRLPGDVLPRLDALIPYVEDSTEMGRVKPTITRADVLRLVLDLGIDVVENRASMAEMADRERRLLSGA